MLPSVGTSGSGVAAVVSGVRPEGKLEEIHLLHVPALPTSHPAALGPLSPLPLEMDLTLQRPSLLSTPWEG